MKIKKQSTKMISMILILLMVFMLPLQVCAEVIGGEKEEEQTADFTGVSSDIEEIGDIVSEITGERTENSKTFLLSDGTKMLAEYPDSIHFKNENGNWTEYNNTLVKTIETATNDEITKECDYTNKKSDIDVTLSSSANNGDLIKLSDDKYKISWGFKNADDSDIRIITQDNKITGNEKFTNLENLSSEAEYKNVFDNVDLQYEVSSTGVKENIILNNSESQNEFEIVYNINKLIPNQINDNTIILYDGNRKIYEIDAPYMIDSKGVSSKKLKFKVISNNNGKLNVKLVADRTFISDSSRSFPITIDPEISYINNTNVFTYTGFIGENASSYPPYYLSSNAYSNWKINSLPVLDNSQVVIKATANFNIGSITGAVSKNNPIIVNLYNGKTTSPYYNTQVEDYCAISSANDKLEFDFTRLLKNWMNGSTNNGFVIKSNNIGNRTLNISYGQTIHTESEGTQYKNYPMYTIVYKDFSGKEDSHSYHTVSAGSRAEVSVNDYLGNLVVSQNLYESKTQRMPVSLSATYNSFDYNTSFSDSMIGYGWKFSFNQYIKGTNSTLQNAGYDYVYIDENKSKHYLKENPDNSDEWQDEEDLGLTLTVDNNYYYLDDGSKTMKFKSPSSGGNLVYESENEITSNHIGYGRSTDGTINYIYNSTNTTVVSFSTTTINGKKYISTINLPKSKKIYLTYSSSNSKVLLTKVTMPDGSISQYSYTNSGILNSVKYVGNENGVNQNGQTVTMQYNSNGQVTNISEISTEGNTGNSLTYQYNNDNTTRVTDRKGRSETYTFDDEGSKISTQNSNGFITAGGESDLTASSGADSFTKNYIEESHDFKGVGSGYYFKKSNGSINCNTIKRIKYFGRNSLQVTSNSTSSSTGVEHQFEESDFIGNDITFSAYVKTNISTASSDTAGAYLQIKCVPSSDSNPEIKSFYVNSTNEWQRISVTANVPDSTQYVVVSCNIENAVGTAYYDCLQLEMGKSANDYNALQDSDFNTNSTWYDESDSLVSVSSGSAIINGSPGLTNRIAEEEYEEETEDNSDTDNTTPQETTVVTEHDEVDTTDSYGNIVESFEGEYERVYYVDNTDQDTNDTDDSISEDTSQDTSDDSTQQSSNKYIYQTINVKTADVYFNLIGEAKANSVPITNSQRTFGVVLNIYYQNANGEVSEIPEEHYQEFNVCTTSRQTVSIAVTPDDTDMIIDHVDFAFVYGYNSNSMTIYNAMLNISVNKANVLNTDIEEDESSDDETEETTTSTEPEDSEEDVVLGDMVSEEPLTTNPYIKTKTKYDSTGNYVLEEKDELGSTTSYTYDGYENVEISKDENGNVLTGIINTNGNIVSITDGNGNVVEYEYDAADNVTSISSGNSSNSYTYDYLGNVSLITHNNFSYQFNYNQYNKLIETKVGSNQIVTNEYDSNYGNLIRTTYGNGDYISYEYDLYDNITGISNNTGTIATFEYNKKGLISKIEDQESGETTHYYYDFNGEVQGQYIFSNNGSLSKTINYDEDGNTVEKTSVEGVSRTITSGTDNNGEAFVNYDGLQSTKKTDDFNRVTSINTSIDSASPFITTYKYANGSEENSTSNTVNRLENRYRGNSYAVYNYTYDANGNITEVKENGNTIYRYTYDSLNQLKEEYDFLIHKHTRFTYDNSGNITMTLKSTLSSSGTIGGVCGSKNYTYGDSAWKDKLTRYGSTTITYDAIGNPLSYRNGMTFEWKNGRWLAGTTLSDNTTLTYQYNVNGMRIKKKVNDTATKYHCYYYYYDSNNNLIGLILAEYEKNDETNKYDRVKEDVAFFYYDADNSPVSMKYNDNMYYYVKNLQGDIVKILNSNGGTVASYAYDSWGNITDSTVNNSTVANMSPFRYRGYVYDTETGLYYLQSRYYDPVTGRFINADDTAYIGATGTVLSCNLFTYCENKAIQEIDVKGTSPLNKNKSNNNVNPNKQKTFTIVYKNNGGKGKHMSNTIVKYGKKKRLRALTYHKTYYSFSGWGVYRKSDNKWLCKDASTGKKLWLSSKLLKNNTKYKKYLYKNRQFVSKISSVNNDTIIMYAQWKDKVYSKTGRDTYTINAYGDGDNLLPYSIRVYYNYAEKFHLRSEKVTYFYRKVYVSASTECISPGFNCSCTSLIHKNKEGENIKCFNMKSVKDYLVPRDLIFLYYKYNDEKVSYKRKNSNKGVFSLSVQKSYATLNRAKTITYHLSY